MSKTELKSACGLGTDSAYAAITRCLGDGRLEQATESYYDENDRQQTRKVLRAPSHEVTP